MSETGLESDSSSLTRFMALLQSWASVLADTVLHLEALEVSLCA